MAELMFGLGQTKKKKQTEAKVKQEKDDRWKYQGRPDEDVEATQRKEHFHRDNNYKATQKATKDNMKDVTITGTVETAARDEQFNREKQYKEEIRTNKKKLQDVNMAIDTVESEVRKEQHNREKDWKDTGRKQKDANSNFDMARALFN